MRLVLPDHDVGSSVFHDYFEEIIGSKKKHVSNELNQAGYSDSDLKQLGELL
jgi:hypothetical protein